MSVIFYYDVVCPFAYMASRLIEGVGLRAGVSVTWRPVLLGGLYEATSAPQGKAGSATDVMSPAKLQLTGVDLHRQLLRRGVPYREPSYHPQKTVLAMKLLAGVPDNVLRATLSHALYRAYWCEGRDVADASVLQEVVGPFGVDASELVHSKTASEQLRANTLEASERGAFGVPGFYVGGQLYWGTDRMFLVERQLGIPRAAPERLAEPERGTSARLTFFFDYSSPWSFLACMRLEELLQSVEPVQVTVEWVPLLLGALFKKIGTPLVPALALSEAKRRYMERDLQDWCGYAGVQLHWPAAFPLRSVLPLRVTLASHCEPRLIKSLYIAAWQENKDIGRAEVLQEVLDRGSWNSHQLMAQAETEAVKSQLFTNTTRAEEEGLCGVPSFRVNNGPVVWGQDKLNIVADMICGWQDHMNSSL